MKNYQISPGQIPHLVRLTADLFREMNKEIDPVLRPGNMHFVADLLKDLVDTAYPIENEPAKSKQPDNSSTTENENKKIKELAYRYFVDLMRLRSVPKHLIVTFEEWERGLK